MVLANTLNKSTQSVQWVWWKNNEWDFSATSHGKSDIDGLGVHVNNV